MKIGAIAPWFGSKRAIAPAIVEQLGPHHAYWEVFCGSMAVLMGKPACRMETVNDLHGDLVNLSRVLQHDRLGPALYRRLRRTLAAQDELLRSRRKLKALPPAEFDQLSPDRAYHYFINSWLSMNGTAGSLGSGDSPEGKGSRRGIARRFSAEGGAPAVRFASAVDSIPSWRRRLRRVFVLRGCGIELCEKIEDREGVVIYADPPYLVKGEKYVHDFSEEDHERLAVALNRFKKTRVVVSYYEAPQLGDLYTGWTKVSVDVQKFLANPNGKGKQKAPEVLLINGPAATNQPTLFDRVKK
jgi:DNA adenine methylase